MKNPFNDPEVAELVLQIETLVSHHDFLAKERDLMVTDSDAKSALRQTMGALKGRKPKAKPKKAKDHFKAKLSSVLAETLSTSGSSNSKCLHALKVTEDSLVTRREMNSHPRGYLNFLEGFLIDGKVA